MGLIVAFYCKYCGHEEIHSQGSKYRRTFLDEIPKKCPKCRRKLETQDERFYMESEEFSSGIRLQKHMESLRASADAKKAEEEASKYVKKVVEKKCVLPKNSKVTRSTILPEGRLKDYLYALIQSYSCVFYLQKRMENLLCQKYKNEIALRRDQILAKAQVNDQIQSLLQKRNSLSQRLDQLRTGELTIKPAELKRAGCVMPTKPEEPSPPKPIDLTPPPKPSEPNYQKPHFWNKKKVIANNALLKTQYEVECQEYDACLEAIDKVAATYQACLMEYEAEMEKYRPLLSDYENEVAKFKSKKITALQSDLEKVETRLNKAQENAEAQEEKLFVKSPSYALNEMLTTQVKFIQSKLDAVAKTINELYAYDIIYPKYRGYIEVCAFYEYLDAGRCDTLDGPFGAYNLYESDVKANLIIQHLSKVVENLEAIKGTQHMIYSEMKKMNAELGKIEKSLDKAVQELGSLNYYAGEISSSASEIAASSSLVAHNTALTAYYSAENAHWAKRNAELTNSLGFLIAMK